jgi:hypothetical protein
MHVPVLAFEGRHDVGDPIRGPSLREPGLAQQTIKPALPPRVAVRVSVDHHEDPNIMLVVLRAETADLIDEPTLHAIAILTALIIDVVRGKPQAPQQTAQ